MTYQEFKNKYNGKLVDYDGCYGGQCWDLVQQYFTECLEVPPSVLGGCGLVNNMLLEPKLSQMLEYFDEVDIYHMITGDTCIWEIGHIAIYDSYDGTNCWYLTQNNGSAENPSGATHLGMLNIGNFRAFRKKGIKPQEPTLTEYTIQNGDTLWDICVRFYGDGTKYAEVATRNGITNPDLIYPGQVIKL